MPSLQWQAREKQLSAAILLNSKLASWDKSNWPATLAISHIPFLISALCGSSKSKQGSTNHGRPSAVGLARAIVFDRFRVKVCVGFSVRTLRECARSFLERFGRWHVLLCFFRYICRSLNVFSPNFLPWIRIFSDFTTCATRMQIWRLRKTLRLISGFECICRSKKVGVRCKCIVGVWPSARTLLCLPEV